MKKNATPRMTQQVLAKLVELMGEEEAAAAICRRQPMELVSDVGPNGNYSVNDFAKYLKAVD
jgi:hypothetical protein